MRHAPAMQQKRDFGASVRAKPHGFHRPIDRASCADTCTLGLGQDRKEMALFTSDLVLGRVCAADTGQAS